MTERVFFFGCWNRDGCVDGRPDYRAAVLAAVKADGEVWSRGLVAGDNIYPETGKDENGNKTKTAYKRTLESGFRMLMAVTKPVVVGLGNHDVECKDVLADMKMKSSTNVLEVKDVGPSDSFDRLYLIDTNVDRQKTKAWEDMIDGLETWLNSKTDDEWLFVMGHEPIMALKQKKLNVCTDPLPRAEQLLKVMSTRRCVYLCADVHNFQVGAFHGPGAPHPVFQVVCGTGGASPDPMKAFVAQSDVGESDWKLHTAASMQPYGYCSLEIPSEKVKPLKVTYVMVASSEPDYNSDSSGSDESDSPLSTQCGGFGFTLGWDYEDGVNTLDMGKEECRRVPTGPSDASCTSGNAESYTCNKGGALQAGGRSKVGSVSVAASLGLLTLLCSATGALR